MTSLITLLISVWLTASAQGFAITKRKPSFVLMDAGEHFAPDMCLSGLQRVIVPLEMRHEWHTSVDPTQHLTFGAFWDRHIDFLESHLTNLRYRTPKSRNGSLDFSTKQGKGCRLVNMCFESDEYRKIRMSYYDGGKGIQVFQAVWYPNPVYNLPVLGIEMARFSGGKAHMIATDFQPIHTKESQHAMPYRHIIDPIREKYPTLQDKMSDKYYDHTHFNEGFMLHSRFSEEGLLEEQVFPAITEYMQAHVKMIREAEPNKDDVMLAIQGQEAYDKYFAKRDQGSKVYKAKFGEEWADSFVHDFVFELSR